MKHRKQSFNFKVLTKIIYNFKFSKIYIDEPVWEAYNSNYKYLVWYMVETKKKECLNDGDLGPWC